MISAQIDELRERANVLRQGRWSDGADDARLIEDAADTIWELRDDLQRANRENAKLRELARDMWFWGYQGHIDSESQEWQMKHIDGVLDRMRELGVEVNE